MLDYHKIKNEREKGKKKREVYNLAPVSPEQFVERPSEICLVLSWPDDYKPGPPIHVRQPSHIAQEEHTTLTKEVLSSGFATRRLKKFL